MAFFSRSLGSWPSEMLETRGLKLLTPNWKLWSYPYHKFFKSHPRVVRTTGSSLLIFLQKLWNWQDPHQRSCAKKNKQNKNLGYLDKIWLLGEWLEWLTSRYDYFVISRWKPRYHPDAERVVLWISHEVRLEEGLEKDNQWIYSWQQEPPTPW